MIGDLEQMKQQLHRLVDEMPPDRVPAVLRYVRDLHNDPVLFSLLNAPSDDESYTQEQRDADREAESAILRGEGIPHSELLREFGL